MKRMPDKVGPDGHRQIVLEHEWRQDFVGEALTIEVDDSGKISSFELYSANHGVVRWNAGRGLGGARRWETEDEAKDTGGVPGQYYPTALLDGATTDMQSLAIIEEVMGHFEGTPLAGCIREALAEPHVEHVLDEGWLPEREAEAPSAPPRPSAKRGFARLMGRAVLDLMRPYAAWSGSKAEDDSESE